MKKSEAKSQPSVDATLEAPVRLTPEQLEIVAAGFMKQISPVKGGGTATTGYAPPPPVLRLF